MKKPRPLTPVCRCKVYPAEMSWAAVFIGDDIEVILAEDMQSALSIMTGMKDHSSYRKKMGWLGVAHVRGKVTASPRALFEGLGKPRRKKKAKRGLS